MKIVRTVSLEEIRKYYEDLDKLAVILNHEAIEDDRGTWRWYTNSIVNHLTHDKTCEFYTGEWLGGNVKLYRGSVSLNDLWLQFLHGKFSIPEMMKFHMGLGSSLSGFEDVFGQRSAKELGLDDYDQSRGDDNPEDWIQYICRIYRGQVLKV